LVVRETARFTATQLVLLTRDRQLLFWNVVFFFLMLIVFLGPLSGGDASVRVTLTASVVTIGVMASALFSVAVGLTAARERGVFRRYALTPVPAGVVVSGTVIARVLLILAGAALQVVVARTVFHVPWSGGWTSWATMLVSSSVAFGSLGFAIAAAAPSPHVANTLANLLFIPMMALSGTALPVAFMPDAWQHLAWMLPPAMMLDGLLGAFVRAESAADQVMRVAYLAVWTIVPGAVGIYLWARRGA
jgi:ABC-2 type transport system permease protein